jgi:Peptidase family M28
LSDPDRDPEQQRLRGDVEALAAMVRGSAGPGEGASAEWVAQSLTEAGATDVRVERFRYQPTYCAAHALHAAAGLLAARLGGLRGAALAIGALASLELEASGRNQWSRRLLPRHTGANVLGRVAGARGAREETATVVVVAHHDAARTGLFWSRAIVEAGAARRRRRRRTDPALAPTAVGLALACAGALTASRSAVGRLAATAGRALMALTLAGLADIATSPTVPGASDNATGVAALLAIARRAAAEPLDGVEVILLAPGCEEAGMGGMAAFLSAHGAALHPARTLVLGLDTLGAGTPIVCTAEATLLEHSYSQRDVALAEEGARRAGVEAPKRWRIGTWTDPILARFAGLPAISLLSVGPKGVFTDYHRMSDVPEHVDFDCVEHSLAIAWGVLEEVAAASARAPEASAP